MRDEEYFYEFEKIVRSVKHNYTAQFKKIPGMMEWIDSKTPLLQDSIYKLKTKIFWILNGLTDFPVCEVCGKSLIGKNVRTVDIGYLVCSVACANRKNEKKEKAKQTNLEKCQ